MQTFTVQVTDDNGLKALHALEQKHIIRIVDEAEIDFPSLPGKPLSVKAFKIWISDAENISTVDLKQAKKNGREMIASAAPRKKTTPKTFPVRLSLNALQNIDEIKGYVAFIKLQPINAIQAK